MLHSAVCNHHSLNELVEDAKLFHAELPAYGELLKVSASSVLLDKHDPGMHFGGYCLVPSPASELRMNYINTIIRATINRKH